MQQCLKLKINRTFKLSKIFSHERFEKDQLSHKTSVVQISAYNGKLSVLRLVISFDNNLSVGLSSCEAGVNCYLVLARVFGICIQACIHIMELL